MTAEKADRANIHAALNALPGPEVSRSQLASFFQNLRRYPNACEVSALPPEPVPAEPAPEPIRAEPKPSALAVFATMAAREEAEAARCPMDWPAVLEWARHNRVPTDGDVLAAVNAKRAGVGLPPFDLVPERVPFEPMPALVVSRDGDVRS